MTVGDYGRTTHKDTSSCIKYTFIEGQSPDMTALPVTATPSITLIISFENYDNWLNRNFRNLKAD